MEEPSPRCWFCGAPSAGVRRLRLCYTSNSINELTTHTEACGSHLEAAESLGALYNSWRLKRQIVAVLDRALTNRESVEVLEMLARDIDLATESFNRFLDEGRRA